MKAETVFRNPGDGAVSFWKGEDNNTLVCLGVRGETHDVKSFIFAPKQPGLFSFKPGQFLTFDFVIDGVVVQRCYTISSSPTRPYVLTITVKRVPGGLVSNWLHDNMQPGVEVSASAPLGAFTFVDAPAEKYLLLSGGSGITPMMSMARAQFDLGNDSDMVFMHHARSPVDIIFRRELEAMELGSRRFRFVPVCDEDAPFHFWSGLRGRMTGEMLALAVPDFAQREVFVCGPPPYMRAVKTMLATRGFDMARYHEESFEFAVAEAEPAPAASADDCKVEFTISGRHIACSRQVTLLDAARAEGLRLPASCGKGLCGTCKSKLLSGNVEMSHQGGIRQKEIDQGMILLCCSKPLGDLVIER